MGSGDWNDGMDRVGEHGKGESIWLAFFLYGILLDFIEIAQLAGGYQLCRTMQRPGRRY